MTVLLFEDEFAARLYPATLGRPAMAIHCGGYRLCDLIGRLDQPTLAIVRGYLQAIVDEDYALPAPSPGATDGPTLWVNARLAPTTLAIDSLAELLKANQPAIVSSGEAVAAALAPAGVQLSAENLLPENVAALLRSLQLPPREIDLPLLDYPHDIVRRHMTSFAANLDDRIRRGDYRQLADGLFAAEGAKLGQYVVVDSSRGPIVLEQGATVGPHSYLSGPILIGRNTRVIEHASIKDGVSIGHTAKIGGEVEASIIEPYTNKQHHGFLGHSYLGSWINLGAGTCNSDLKNTYGMVKMEYQGEKVDTNMQFIGCIMGDYAKSAVNTSIFTGKTIGACSMLYGFVTTNVPSFVNYARSFGQTTESPPEVMQSTQARMFARRNVPQRPCDVQLLHAMHDLTRHERQLANDPLSL